MNRKHLVGSLVLTFLSLAFLAGCGGGGGSHTTPAVETISATSGSSQTIAINTAFSAPLVATVTTGGTATSGVSVTFTAPSSGASGTFAGGGTTAMATTNSSGVATSPVFTANSTAGAFTVHASATGASTQASFSLTITAGPAASIGITGGSNQSIAINTAAGTNLSVTVTDAGGNPVSGATVTFTAPSSGASGTFAGGVHTATTNSSGVATSAAFTANGTVGGPYHVNATVSGVVTPAIFTLTNVAALTTTITATSGTPQTAAINTAFAATLVATVLSGTNPVSGATVTFAAPSSGASCAFAGGLNTAVTNGSGVATSAVCTANGTSGSYAVTASVTGAATPASFSLTNGTSVAATITATSGTPQSATVSTAFAATLVATVLDSSSNPVSGATVTFAAPSSGASGTFAGGVNTATTNSSGVATSAVFTANSTVGGPYTVTAAVSGVVTAANFLLTNTAIPTYSFYVSGLESANGGPNYYAIAGSVQINASGTVLSGVQDYNDGYGVTSPQPAGDTISGGTLTVDPTSGLGTLALITNNTKVGVSGTETFGVQFVNAKHAVIAQFDGTATASGSMDFQTVSGGIPNGNYSFTLSGVDSSYFPTVFGGVFTVSNGGTSLLGLVDVDDDGTVSQGSSFNGTISSANTFGRGTLTGTNFAGSSTTLNYYIVGPETIRIIDVDPSVANVVSDSAVGSAFSQGSGTFDNTSIGASVFGFSSTSYGFFNAAAAGQITVPASGTFTGVADDDEVSNDILVTKAPIAGTYSIASNGYGSLSLTSGNLGEVSTLGVYMTDPTLNLTDPNNTTSGLGGALIADLDEFVSGTGLLVPQTDTASASFTGKYTFGGQDFDFASASSGWEFDFAGAGSVTNLALSGTGVISDPFTILTNNLTDSGVTFTGTATPDVFTTGRYTLPLTVAGMGVCSTYLFNTAIYQANSQQLFWLNEDTNTVFLSILQQQGSLTGVPAIKKAHQKKKASGVKPNC